MRICIRCNKVRFPWRFASRTGGDCTEVADVCRPCARQLGVNMAFAYNDKWLESIAKRWAAPNWVPEPMTKTGLQNVIMAALRDLRGV